MSDLKTPMRNFLYLPRRVHVEVNCDNCCINISWKGTKPALARTNAFVTIDIMFLRQAVKALCPYFFTSVVGVSVSTIGVVNLCPWYFCEKAQTKILFTLSVRIPRQWESFCGCLFWTQIIRCRGSYCDCLQNSFFLVVRKCNWGYL